VIRLYAFADGVRSLPDELTATPVAGLTAVVGADTEADALAHGLAVEQLRDRCDTVLPVRFGERFADEGALVAAVEPRRTELLRALDSVRGCVELAVRASLGSGARTTVLRARSDGTSYMRRRLAAYTAERDAVDTVDARLRPLARDARLSTRDGALHASYLVERGRVEPFKMAAVELAALLPDLRLTCTGPWAPYSFAEQA
jgi:Gas vesicle synthesis protein GvpL/GvpF